jgi:hypothetical protein
VRLRPLLVLIAAVVAVLLAGAVVTAEVVTAEVARADDGEAVPCHRDVRCSGQSLTTATGPLAPPTSWSAVLAAALLAGGVAGAAAVVLHDRLSASRLFRPPRLAA